MKIMKLFLVFGLVIIRYKKCLFEDIDFCKAIAIPKFENLGMNKTEGGKLERKLFGVISSSITKF